MAVSVLSHFLRVPWVGLQCVIVAFLAHKMRTSEILTWDRKSYLTHVILPRLSGESCTLVVLELTRMVIIVMFK